MKFSTSLYYYLIVPSVVGGVFKLVAWTLEKFQLVSWGEWAFTTGFIVSLLLFRPSKQWKTVTDPEFKYQVDFPEAQPARCRHAPCAAPPQWLPLGGIHLACAWSAVTGRPARAGSPECPW